MLNMKSNPKLIQALRENTRKKKLARMVQDFSVRLQIQPEEIRPIALEESDNILAEFQSRFKNKKDEKIRIDFRGIGKELFLVLLDYLAKTIPDTPMLLFGKDKDDCGAIEIGSTFYIRNVMNLIDGGVLVYAIDRNVANCIEFDCDENYSQIEYSVSATGREYAKIINNWISKQESRFSLHQENWWISEVNSTGQP